ncbi:MAG: DUF3100 domain-containing protein [Alcaligenaceae bacterium]|nr:DUF3100 domain-containing protein [Alcaligenaceae bacterium]
MTVTLKQLFNWRIHVLALVLACLAELIGIARFDIGIGTVLLLPLLYAFVFSLLFNPNIVPSLGRVVGKEGNKIATQWILVSLTPFIAKFAVGIGPNINEIIAAGPSLILQELGNVGTVVLAMPVAVLLFGMGRESIGATHSIAREPNIALIADRYGLKTPEGIGVMGVYVMGTLFGAVYFSIVPSLIASWGVFDIRALAMACGVGSGSMMGACSASLAELVPENKDEIIAFAASSNLLTYGTGLFLSIFVALPLAERLYKVLDKMRNKGANKALSAKTVKEDDLVGLEDSEESKLSVAQMLIAVTFSAIIILLVNWVGTGVNPLDALPGMLILLVCCYIGVIIKEYIPVNIPSIAWISIVAIFSALPFMPMDDYVIEATNKLGLLPMLTPSLAYAGFAISQSEVKLFKRSGFKIAIVAILVFTGTYIGSVIIADALL